MFQIRTVQKENKARAEYTVVIPLRRKKAVASFLAFPAAVPPETPRSFAKNSFGVVSRIASFLLIGLFFFNPVLDVYADEIPLIVSGESIAIEAAEKPPVPIDVPPAVADETSAPELAGLNTEAEVAEIATSTEDVIPTSPKESTPEVVPESVSPEPEIIPTETPASSTPIITETVPDPSPETATTTEIAAKQETNPVEETAGAASTTEESIRSEVAELGEISETPSPEEAPAAETVREVVREVIREVIVEHTPPAPVVNVIEKKYLFRENECTLLDDGAFYCLPPETASTTVVSDISLPRVLVENDGDKEIFFEDVNEKKKITDNDFDDGAPSYDKQSNLIVWHSLIKGRYQIMLAGAGTSTARQITDVSYNNTDPKVRGKSVVWQGWAGNNWEIFYIKDVTAEPLAIEQITTNEQPDMFPIISDNFITWQSFFGGSWHVFVYTIENGQISQISRPEAGRYENPRFALLFENRKENGEVETVGYDVVSGKEIPINAPHAPFPVPPPQEEKDKAVPVPAGASGTGTTTPMKNPGKDEEGEG